MPNISLNNTFNTLISSNQDTSNYFLSISQQLSEINSNILASSNQDTSNYILSLPKSGWALSEITSNYLFAFDGKIKVYEDKITIPGDFYNDTYDMTVWYKFDGTNGTNDSSGNGKNATATGTPTVNNEIISITKDNYLTLPDPNFDFNNDITIAFWYRFDNAIMNGRLLEYGALYQTIANHDNAIKVTRNGTGTSMYFIVDTLILSLDLGHLTGGSLTHLIWVIKKNNTWIIYKNGVLIYNNTQVYPKVNTYIYSYLGKSRWSTGNEFDFDNQVSLKDFRIYNRVLTAYEINIIYNQTNGLNEVELVTYNDLSKYATYNLLQTKQNILTAGPGITISENNTISCFDGDYNNLVNKPILFDGDYNSLTNKLIAGSNISISTDNTISLIEPYWSNFKDVSNIEYISTFEFYEKIKIYENNFTFSPIFTQPTVTGGTITQISDSNYYYAVFTSTSGTNIIYFPQTTVCDVLVVGGGGSGGSRHAGGGGAGAYIYLTNQIISSGTYTIGVGSGGASVQGAGIPGNNGGDTYIRTSLNNNIYLAIGGGGGGAGATVNGKSGGSSGGCTITGTTPAAVLTTNIPTGAYGNIGGSTTGYPGGGEAAYAGAGGGGFGSVGGNVSGSTTNTTGGNGGSGVLCNITGVSQPYAAGGGGGCSLATTGTAGSGGYSSDIKIGGDGSKGAVTAGSGVANTGSGGGGAGFNGASNGASGAGGSGIVIIRWTSIPDFHLVAMGDTNLTFGTNNTNRMIITNNGNIGIGTSNPQYSLDVNGTLNCTSLNISNVAFNSNNEVFINSLSTLTNLSQKIRVNDNIFTFGDFGDYTNDPIITNGTINNIIGTNYYYAVFTSTSGTNTITFPQNTVCNILMVGGGGAGGINLGGGGGAGAVLYAESVEIPAGVYSITIGQGGRWDGANPDGFDTIGFGAQVRGGGGAYQSVWTNGASGRDGGSGSGGKSWSGSGPGIGGNVLESIKGSILASATVYGNVGGNGTIQNGSVSSAGGGGAMAPGNNGWGNNGTPANGGDGFQCNIDGNNYYYGGGGGGAFYASVTGRTGGSGGKGGGGGGGGGGTAGSIVGNGDTFSINPGANGSESTGGNAGANTGGGGGGSRYSDAGNGGSGIVIVRWYKSTKIKITIGETASTDARLSVASGITSTGTTNLSYFNYDTTSLTTTSTSITDNCAVFDSSIWVKSSIASSSDVRIKKNIKDIEDDDALNKILSIEPKTYDYVDQLERGTSNVYGFIAQQIKEVIPNAVKLERGLVPNIYSIATCEGSNIYLTSNKDISDILSNNIYLKTIDETGKENISKIISYTSNSITIDNTIGTSNIFVYGTEIKDFHTIDKSYIYTLNVCATQILSRKVDTLQQKNDMLIQENEMLNQEILSIKSHLELN